MILPGGTEKTTERTAGNPVFIPILEVSNYQMDIEMN
jgi:hypothetical protein